MKTSPYVLTAFVCVALSGSISSADDLQPIEGEKARQIAKHLVDEANKIEKTPIRIDANTEKANGIHVPDKVGILVVPQKDLKESEELAAKFKTEKGASLAYLFMYHIVPVLNGKAVDNSQLRSVTFKDDDGREHKIHLLLLAVKLIDDDDYRLHAYGQGEQPLVDSKFAEGGSGAEPVTVEIKDRDETTHQGKLVVTVFGKYQASFQCGYRGD